MNSWGKAPLERRIDSILEESVEPGSEPAGFSVTLLPARPSFPWMKVASVLAAAVICAFIAYPWIRGLELHSLNFRALFSPETMKSLFAGMDRDKAVSLAAVVIGIAGTVMVFAPEGDRVLRRML